MKDRIDVILVNKGLFPSRERAKTALMEGIVFVDGQRVDKAGTKIDEESGIEIKGNDLKYVSRGGYKLEKAIDSFGLSLEGKVCCDIGASTGGFTDCMLKNGAEKVFSVDVGYGQLDWKLRNDKRVVNIEKCNVRYMDPSVIGEKVDFVSCDVSFISLSMVFPVISRIMKDDATCVALVKPQFEAGKEEADKGKGIIRDPEIHVKVLEKAGRDASENGLLINGIDYSPIKGSKGNIEFLISLVKVEKLAYNANRVLKKIHEIVDVSQRKLNG